MHFLAVVKRCVFLRVIPKSVNIENVLDFAGVCNMHFSARRVKSVAIANPF